MLRSMVGVIDLANPAIGCLFEMHRYLIVIEVLATIGVAKLLAFAAMNPHMLLEVTARHRHLEEAVSDGDASGRAGLVPRVSFRPVLPGDASTELFLAAP